MASQASQNTTCKFALARAIRWKVAGYILTFALIFSLMTQLNLSTETQQVTKGLIVLGAVLLQRPEARY